jgi:HK97 family phage prohead protease
MQMQHRFFTREAADQNVFTRDVTLSPQSWNAEARTFSVVVSSGSDVERRDHKGIYIERPSIDQNWHALVGSPVLNAHQRTDIKNILGSVIDVAVVGKEVHATIRMSKSPEGEAAVQAALEGHLRGVSFGYRIDATKESTEGGKRIVTITKLTPIEISLVPIPADPAAVIRGDNAMPGIVTGDPIVDRAAANAEIRSIAKITSLPQQWIDTQIDTGASIDQARAAAFEELKARSAAGATIRTATASVGGVDSNDPAVRTRAIGEALATRLTGQAPPELARDFVGLTSVELCRELLRTSGLSTIGPPGVIVERAMTTSDLPVLMGDAINRSMRIAYQAVSSGARAIDSSDMVSNAQLSV